MTSEIINKLVTCGAGFIGSSLFHFLTKPNFNLLYLDNFDHFYSEEIKLNNIESLLTKKSFALIWVDIRDAKLLKMIFDFKKIGAVIHLAAKSGVRNSILNPSKHFDINVTGTLTLLESADSKGIKTLGFDSLSLVCGNQNEKRKGTYTFNEQMSPYAVSKKTAELFNFSFYVNFKMNVINLRFFGVYGKNQRPDLVIHKFSKQISQNTPIEIYGSGEIRRSCTYIYDVVEAFYNSILYLEQTPKTVEIINIGNDNSIILIPLLDCI